MPLDAQFLLSQPPVEVDQEISPRDVILYALGVGADELPFVYEKELQPLPTYAAVLGYGPSPLTDPRLDIDVPQILQGEVAIRFAAPLPVSGHIHSTNRIGPIYDKGDKGVVIYSTREIRDSAGNLLAETRDAGFLRGAGGCGGSPGEQPRPHPIP